MAKQLTDNDIETVVKILDGWTGKLTWEALIDAIQIRIGCRYTRQALDRHERIKRAYNVRKNTLRHGTERPEVRSVELQKALQRIERLTAENERLKAENNALLEQFARWAYNAHTKGHDEAILNRPLPAVNRDTTKTP